MNKHILLIPGPVTTSKRVKEAMIHDYASREKKMLKVIQEIRSKLLKIGNANSNDYTSIIFQGTGTYSNEAVLGTIPDEKEKNIKLVIFSNGVYGERLYQIGLKLKINVVIVKFSYQKKINKNNIIDYLDKDHDVTHIGMVHNETTTGVLNPIDEIAPIIKAKGIWFMIDAISSFGGIPINMDTLNIDYVVGSSNKCLHSFPGLSFVIAKKKTLIRDNKNSKSLSLNLFDQMLDFENSGQFRYTPPPQLLNALLVAINELIEGGGVINRHNKYKKLNELLHQRFEDEGIISYIGKEDQGPINSTFYFPKNIKYETFCSQLAKKNITIYKSSVNPETVFRIGNIGEISEKEFLLCLDILINELKFSP
ncbi:Aminotransferase class-V [seawater metagenome]|uniref:2-aminoethylphosphonate--pyruvate transaminase n=1 Tax=seawater metagenome TaxID=1561972 RepID=A0A5E8CLF2_9ZZZZ